MSIDWTLLNEKRRELVAKLNEVDLQRSLLLSQIKNIDRERDDEFRRMMKAAEVRATEMSKGVPQVHKSDETQTAP